MISTAPIGRSTNIKAVGYDPATKTLQVDYHKKRSYTYTGVPPETHSNLLAAESPGKFLHENVIGRFKTTEAQ